MPKRRKREPDIDPALLELLAQDAGRGVSPHVLDRAPWLNDHWPDAPWYDALEKLDKTKDKTLLIDLLKSDQELTPAIRGHIANLLERYRLRRPPGKQATPSYDLSDTSIRLWLLIYAMHSEGEMSAEQAAEKYATDEFSADTLLDAYQGKHGGFARAMKRAKR